MKDVYAGDDGLAEKDGQNVQRQICRFVVNADADPDALLKIAASVMLSNTLPRSLSLASSMPQKVVINVEMENITASTAESIRRKLLQLTCTESVELYVD